MCFGSVGLPTPRGAVASLRVGRCGVAHCCRPGCCVVASSRCVANAPVAALVSVPVIGGDRLNELERGIIARRLLDNWMNCDRPLDVHDRDWWLTRFRRIGFTSDGIADEALRPIEGIVLARGAVPSARDGLAWTPDLPLAQWFADRCRGKVWLCYFEPDRLLAHLGPSWGDVHVAGASEYICDPAGLLIEPL